VTTAINILKRIKHIPKKPLVIADPVDIRIAEAKAQMAIGDLYDSQVDVVRQRNFQLAQETRSRNIELRAEEERRQDDIAKQRLKNLSKARKVLRKMRTNEA
jgi:hypothetical protein